MVRLFMDCLAFIHYTGIFQYSFGLLCFFISLLISIFQRTNGYCNKYCRREQLFPLVGGRFGLSRNRDIPKWIKSKWFRYGLLIFFFCNVFSDALEHIFGVCRSCRIKAGCNPAVDI